MEWEHEYEWMNTSGKVTRREMMEEENRRDYTIISLFEAFMTKQIADDKNLWNGKVRQWRTRDRRTIE